MRLVSNITAANSQSPSAPCLRRARDVSEIENSGERGRIKGSGHVFPRNILALEVACAPHFIWWIGNLHELNSRNYS